MMEPRHEPRGTRASCVSGRCGWCASTGTTTVGVGGGPVDRGPLDELLERCDEMRRLWEGCEPGATVD
jgi:hypothetical protein